LLLWAWAWAGDDGPEAGWWFLGHLVVVMLYYGLWFGQTKAAMDIYLLQLTLAADFLALAVGLLAYF
jgi:hypothetical protein